MKHVDFDNKKPELFIFLFFVAAYIFISLNHEPWFDEAQAWEIARGASLKEILFVIPHYEGHPPLWHLILAVPAKLGVPFEIGLKLTGAIISIVSVYILIFCSRLPRIVRLLLPFSYFFFYQYGIIVRPYGLMILLMIILGMNYSQRKQHPWMIVALLSLLCLSSAFGVVISGGIAICILIEVIQEIGIKKAVVSIFKNSQLLSLFILLIFALLLLLEIFPKPDTYYPVLKDQNPFIICLICTLFTLPAECFLTSASWFMTDLTLFQTSKIGIIELAILCVVGVVVWTLIICSASKKNIRLLLIPYFLLALFSAKVYLTCHHLGIVFAFLLFWAEFICGEKECFEFGRFIMNKIAINEKDHCLLKKTYIAIGIICLIIPVVWTVVASFHDVKYNYYYSKESADFLKDNNLTGLNILASWNDEKSLSPYYDLDKGYVNTSMIGTAVPINAYFGENLFFNLNYGDSEKGFIYHRRPTIEEYKNDIQKWLLTGYPDMIIGKPDLELVYGDSLSYKDYGLVALIKYKFIWKTEITSLGLPIFVRNDLLDKYHLKALDGIEYTSVNGIEITEEMKEQFYNGVPIEEILKPYLDAMFGKE